MADHRDAQPAVLQGTLELLLLALLARAPSHGYGLARAIENDSHGRLSVEEGSLYPALGRLEKRGEITGAWRPGPSGRRARFYTLTASGRAALASQRALWERLARGIDAVLIGPAQHARRFEDVFE